MINENQASKYCCEDFKLIENYEKAIADTTQTWVCHHKMETHRKNGTKRKYIISQALLIEWSVYYNRPASELIFMTNKEHASMHRRMKLEELGIKLREKKPKRIKKIKESKLTTKQKLAKLMEQLYPEYVNKYKKQKHLHFLKSN